MQALGFLLDQAPGSGPFEQETTTRAVPVHADGRALYQIWKERGGDLAVGRDIPSRRLARFLPHLALCDYRPIKKDFRIRLAGFALVRRFGKDISHHYLSQVLRDDEHECLSSAMMHVRDTGVPAVIDAKIHSKAIRLLHFETVLLRVRAVDLSTPLVLAGMFFFDSRRKSSNDE